MPGATWHAYPGNALAAMKGAYAHLSFLSANNGGANFPLSG